MDRTGTTPGPSSLRSRAPFWGVVLAAVAIVALVATLSGGGSGSGSDDIDADAWDLPALGSDARVRLADFDGKPVVVNFFASWCTTCEFELPGFTKVASALRGQVAFVGVNALETGDGAAMAREFALEENGFVLARDTGGRNGNGLHEALGGRGMPITAFYAADGALVEFVGGALTEDALRTKINELFDLSI